LISTRAALRVPVSCYNGVVRVAPLLLIVPLGVAVLAAGVLPPEHVHRHANASAPIIHAHFESNRQGDEFTRQGDPHQRSVSDTSPDPHETTVGLGQAVGPSQTVRSDYAPSLAPEPVTSLGLGACLSTPDYREPWGTPSPPLGQIIPRAPPA
jgi:hypothetical protein